MNTPTPMPGTADIAKDRADWLLDAIAGATQDRRFLRGDPEYDEVAGEAILRNGEKAIRVALTRTDAALLSALEKARETLVRIAGRDFDCMPHQHGMAAAGHAQTAIHDVEAAIASARP